MEITEGLGRAGLIGDALAQKRAKRRLYCIFQATGWGLVFILPLVRFVLQPSDAKPGSYVRMHPIEFALSRFVFPAILGLLLTHLVRLFIIRRDWERFDWKPLIPRIVATGLVLSFLFVIIIRVVGHCLWNTPQFEGNSKLGYFLEGIGNSILFDGWLVAYFFYHLFERLHRSENERLGLVASVKETELRALKSQVNPHFIFNSLNSLRALIEEDPARARLAVTQLANLLRYSLQSSQLATVSLEEELRVASDYLALEQVRYEDRLRLRINVPPEALPWPMPPMLLQTLVENAVKYGVAQRPEGGEIAIIAHCSDDRMSLQVTNPAAPDTPANLGLESTGVGLRNAATRLRLLFGEGASLRLRVDFPGLVVAEVVVPLKPISL